jgi:hypothetical protein
LDAVLRGRGAGPLWPHPLGWSLRGESQTCTTATRATRLLATRLLATGHLDRCRQPRWRPARRSVLGTGRARVRVQGRPRPAPYPHRPVSGHRGRAQARRRPGRLRPSKPHLQRTVRPLSSLLRYRRPGRPPLPPAPLPPAPLPPAPLPPAPLPPAPLRHRRQRQALQRQLPLGRVRRLRAPLRPGSPNPVRLMPRPLIRGRLTPGRLMPGLLTPGLLMPARVKSRPQRRRVVPRPQPRRQHRPPPRPLRAEPLQVSQARPGRPRQAGPGTAQVVMVQLLVTRQPVRGAAELRQPARLHRRPPLARCRR